MRNWEQVLTVPPATSDWTVTQISQNKTEKNITKKKFVKSQEGKKEKK